MIILMREEWEPEDALRAISQIAGEARIREGTEIYFRPGLPEVDDEGKPILAFIVSGGEVHYWRGEPIKFESPIEK
jgi:hypothetical protein